MEKSNYRVAPGVTQINGQPVPQSGIMELTAAEAMFDKAHGRLTLDAGASVPQVLVDPPRENEIPNPADPIVAPVTRSRRGGRKS
jgi:hypothetical protein